MPDVSPHLPAAPAGPRLRVLVADDNADAADSLAMVIEMLGHEVRTAGDGKDAVEAAREFRPQLVFLDVEMPKLNGYQACRELRRQAEDAPACIVAMTGWGGDEDRRMALEAGFDHHVTKPVDMSAIRQLAERASWPA